MDRGGCRPSQLGALYCLWSFLFCLLVLVCLQIACCRRLELVCAIQAFLLSLDIYTYLYFLKHLVYPLSMGAIDICVREGAQVVIARLAVHGCWLVLGVTALASPPFNLPLYPINFHCLPFSADGSGIPTRGPGNLSHYWAGCVVSFFLVSAR